jgi:hypothetical protein
MLTRLEKGEGVIYGDAKVEARAALFKRCEQVYVTTRNIFLPSFVP